MIQGVVVCGKLETNASVDISFEKGKKLLEYVFIPQQKR